MKESTSNESPLETAAGAAGTGVTDAFELLGNESRLAILLALWEAYVPFDENTFDPVEGSALPFSELRGRVGMSDSGQFNYHLGKLEGQFVHRSENGYLLTPAGQKLVRSIIAGSGLEEMTLDNTAIELACYNCGGPTAVTYQNQRLYHICSECRGTYVFGEEHPDGVIGAWQYSPSGLSDRSAEEIFAANRIETKQLIGNRIMEICPRCTGTVSGSLHVCTDHEPGRASGEVCSTCGRKDEVTARFVCNICKEASEESPKRIVMQHPAVISFYYTHGTSVTYDLTDFEQIRAYEELIESHEVTLESISPPQVLVTIQYRDDELSLAIGEDLTMEIESR